MHIDKNSLRHAPRLENFRHGDLLLIAKPRCQFLTRCPIIRCLTIRSVNCVDHRRLVHLGNGLFGRTRVRWLMSIRFSASKTELTYGTECHLLRCSAMLHCCLCFPGLAFSVLRFDSMQLNNDLIQSFLCTTRQFLSSESIRLKVVSLLYNFVDNRAFLSWQTNTSKNSDSL